MKRSLWKKFILVFVLFGLGSFAFLALMGERLFKESARRTAASELYTRVVDLANEQSNYLARYRQIDLDQLHNYARLTDTRILLLNSENLVVFDTDGGLTDVTIVGFDPAESKENTRIGGFYGSFSQIMISAFAPVNVELSHYGYLTLHQRAAVADSRANDFMLEAYLLYTIFYILSLIILLILRFWVLKPVRDIARGAAEFAEGHLDHRIEVRSQDEIGGLATSLNDMAMQLQSADQTQRNFIANISHDFRSPLTSIRGYLQAMQDGVIPPESRDKYVNIIIGETERLTNLTQSILSLNSLDEARLGLELSVFDIVQVVRSACETFEVVCDRRGISFDLIFGAPQIQVKADIGRIQQALHNLIDNAIKFSYDKGSIRIRVQTVGDKASVSVKDFGCGIEKDDLGKIFNRFYKTDTSRGKDKQGTGLGLSITRDIIAAHGETIDVTSTPGSGTEFIFRLPLAKQAE